MPSNLAVQSNLDANKDVKLSAMHQRIHCAMFLYYTVKYDRSYRYSTQRFICTVHKIHL